MSCCRCLGTPRLSRYSARSALGASSSHWKNFRVADSPRLSTQNDEAVIPTPLLPLSSLSLGLETTFVQPCLPSICQLPEVQSLLVEGKFRVSTAATAASVQLENLRRAVDVFRGLQESGMEHQALMALSAEYLTRTGKFDEALEMLQLLLQQGDTDAMAHCELKLARAKTLWLQGEFSQSLDICTDLSSQEGMQKHPLHFAAARNGMALSKLCFADTLDDAFALRDTPRMVLRFLEKRERLLPARPLATAMAHLNYGSAGIVWAEIVSRINTVEVPLDSAMRAWTTGLFMLEDEAQKKRNRRGPPNTLLAMMQARLGANVAWGVLEMALLDGGLDDPDKAAKYANNALKQYEKFEDDSEKEGQGRVLALLARCYHQKGQAVTAEGLLQTAMDRHAVGPQQMIDKREVLQTYGRLLADWEKRETEGEKLKNEAQQLSMPQGWRGKSAIFSSLWFWTPSLFGEHNRRGPSPF